MSTRTSVCLYKQPVTWIFTRSRFSRLSDSDYKVTPSLKIIIFFQAHISAFMICYTLEHTCTRSYNARATHLNCVVGSCSRSFLLATHFYISQAYFGQFSLLTLKNAFEILFLFSQIIAQNPPSGGFTGTGP